ncbi:MAG: hypothetical protein JW900_06240 [Anaerolineae bacterium]|nr:hypothetical protein [Anaerolineae bacterium]
MRTFLLILAVLVAIPLVLLLLLGIAMLDVQMTLLNAGFWKASVLQNQVYTRLPELGIDVLYEQLASAPPDSEGGLVAVELQETFERQELVDFVAAMVPPAWMQRQVEQNVDALFAWLDGESSYPAVQIDTGGLVDHIEGEGGRDAVQQLLAHLPPCEPGERFDMPAEGFFPDCRPSEEELNEVLDEVLPQLAGAIPTGASYQAALEAGEITPEMEEGMRGIQQAYRAYRLATWGVWGACLLLLGLILLLAARSVKGLFQWAGWPLLTAGGLGLAGMALGYLSAWVLVEYGIAQLQIDTGFSQALWAYVQSLLVPLLQAVAVRGALLAGGMVLVGFIAVVAAAFIPHTRQGN